MPEVAAAMRGRADTIVQLWNEAVKKLLPDADPLTTKQVRDSIPSVLERIAMALESGRAEATAVLTEVSEAHGIARFQEHYKIEELVAEYRILRRITFEQLNHALTGRLTFIQGLAVDLAIDTALQQGVTMFVKCLSEELRAAVDAESKYLAFLSHDVRNNLGSVRLTLRMLRSHLHEDARLQKLASDLKMAQHAVDNTTDGMDRLLAAERLRRKMVKLKLSPVKMRALVDEIAQAVGGKTGVSIENHVPETVTVHSDRELVSLVMQNLVGNAVRYSSRGTVRISATEVELGWEITVADEGPGMPAEQLKTLNNAFSRGLVHGQSGLGLGLTIASHAARQLGSELTVDSHIGRGTSFSFTVPVANP
jgi:signal transduction histidine kinase